MIKAALKGGLYILSGAIVLGLALLCLWILFSGLGVLGREFGGDIWLPGFRVGGDVGHFEFGLWVLGGFLGFVLPFFGLVGYFFVWLYQMGRWALGYVCRDL